MKHAPIDALCREIRRVRDEDARLLVGAVCARLDRMAMGNGSGRKPMRLVGTKRLVEPRAPQRRKGA